MIGRYRSNSLLLAAGFILFFQGMNAQNKDSIVKNTAHSKHAISLILSHTQINEGLDAAGKKQWLSLPSWGINYNYALSNTWSLGLHTDIIVEDFKVESVLRNQETIERSYPVASAVVASYKLKKHFSFLIGTGAEFAKQHGISYRTLKIYNPWLIDYKLTVKNNKYKIKIPRK